MELRPYLRISWRALIAHPGLNLVAGGSTALGIAACSLVLSVASARSVASSGIASPERLALVTATSGRDCRSCIDTFSRQELRDWTQSGLRSVVSLAPYQEGSSNVLLRDGSIDVVSARVSAAFFETLGVHPVFGRAFLADDGAAGAPLTAVLSYGLWRQLGAQRALIGSALRIDGNPVVVIGVMPAGFSFPAGARLWLAAVNRAGDEESQERTLMAVARLRPGVSLPSLQAEMSLAAARRADSSDGRGVAVQSFFHWERTSSDQGQWLLLASVAFAFLISCANVASLYLVRGLARHRELAIRSALGATTRSLAKQLIAESCAVHLGAAAVGLLLAQASMGAASQLLYRFLGTPLDLRLDAGVLLSAGALAVLATLVFALLPLALFCRSGREATLRTVGNGITEGRGHRRLQSGLVALELSLVVTLAAGATLFAGSFRHIRTFDVGFDASRVEIATFSFSAGAFATPQRKREWAEALARDLADRNPGVASAVWSWHFVPVKRRGSRLIEAPVTVDGRGEIIQDRAYPVMSLDGTPGTLRTLGIRLIQGRDFTWEDASGTQPVAIVNAEAARRMWPGEDPIGKRFKLGPASSQNPWLTVVGVTAEKLLPHPSGLGLALLNPGREWAQIYRPLSQSAAENLGAGVRADPGTPAVDLFRISVTDALGGRGRMKIGRFRDFMNESWRLPLVGVKASMLTALSVFGMVLALVGIVGVVGESVQRRLREIGMRIALGARPQHIIFLVTREVLAAG